MQRNYLSDSISQSASLTNLTKHDVDINENIIIRDYTSQQNPFICPADGYIRVTGCTLRIGNPGFLAVGGPGPGFWVSVYVRKGTQAYIDNSYETGGSASFMYIN